MLGMELAMKAAFEKALADPRIAETIEQGKAQLQALVAALAAIEKNTAETLRLTAEMHERILSNGGSDDRGDGQRLAIGAVLDGGTVVGSN